MTLPTKTKKYLDYYYQSRVQTLGISGYHISFQTHEIENYSGYFGYSDLIRKTPLRPNHRFPAASVTKLFTAARIMQLIADGRCRLSTPLRQIFPSIKRTQKIGAVTIEQLLSQRAGLIRDSIDVTGWGYVKSFITFEELKNQLSDRILKTTCKPWYSNYGFALLGLIISELDQLDYEDSLKENIFEPLALKQTSFESDKFAIKRYTECDGDFYPIPEGNKNAFNASGGVISTPADIHKFIRAYLISSELIGSKQLLHKLKTGGKKFGGGVYSLGCAIIQSADETIFCHGGADVGCYSFAGVTSKSNRSFVSYSSETFLDIVGDPRQACLGLLNLMSYLEKDKTSRKRKSNSKDFNSLKKMTGENRNFFGNHYLYDNDSEFLTLSLRSWDPMHLASRIYLDPQNKLMIHHLNELNAMHYSDEPVVLAPTSAPYSYTAAGDARFSNAQFKKFVKKLGSKKKS